MKEAHEVEMGKRGFWMDPAMADIALMRRNVSSFKIRRKERMEEKVKAGFGEARRKNAKIQLYNLAKGFGVAEGKTRLVATFSLQTGYTPKRIEEYLQELEDAGLIKVQGDTIILLGAKEEGERKE